MKRIALYQTDFPGEIDRAGCLAMTLPEMTLQYLSDRSGATWAWPSIERMEQFFAGMHKGGNLSRTLDDRSFGGYVRSHRRYIVGFLRVMGFYDLTVQYIAAHYMQGEARESWGASEDYDTMALQVNTARGNGHFRLWNYDPSPGAGISKVRSVRYYKFTGDLT